MDIFDAYCERKLILELNISRINNGLDQLFEIVQNCPVEGTAEFNSGVVKARGIYLLDKLITSDFEHLNYLIEEVKQLPVENIFSVFSSINKFHNNLLIYMHDIISLLIESDSDSQYSNKSELLDDLNKRISPEVKETYNFIQKEGLDFIKGIFNEEKNISTIVITYMDVKYINLMRKKRDTSRRIFDINNIIGKYIGFESGLSPLDYVPDDGVFIEDPAFA